MAQWKVVAGDCIEVMRDLPDNSFDSMVTDPPAGISFMNLEFDSDKGGRDQWIAWLEEIMREAARLLKPGAHAFVWAIPRTSHWTATAIENSGLEVREICHHIHGQGFPKSQDVGKFIDKLAGAEREVLRVEDRRGEYDGRERASAAINTNWRAAEGRTDVRDVATRVVTSPATEAAKEWDGWGTALKPSVEHWILCRKPLSESSIARNVLKWGCGGLNIDACRVNRANDDVPGWHKTGAAGSKGYQGEDTFRIRDMSAEEIQERCGDKGRWPPNLVMSHTPECRLVGTRKIQSGGSGKFGGKDFGSFADPEAATRQVRGKLYRDADFKETIEKWECAPDCPVAEMDRQSGRTSTTGKRSKQSQESEVAETRWLMKNHRSKEYPGDSGGASRFFPTFKYQPKPSSSERNAGLDEQPDRTLNRVNPGGIENDPRWAPVQVKNNHPTLKGISLMKWLCHLITPAGGYILDPFLGSGSTGCAAVQLGFGFYGCDKDPEYVSIAESRIRYWEAKAQASEE